MDTPCCVVRLDVVHARLNLEAADLLNATDLGNGDLAHEAVRAGSDRADFLVRGRSLLRQDLVRLVLARHLYMLLLDCWGLYLLLMQYLVLV